MLATLLQVFGRRLLVSIPILFLVCLLLFSILRILPVDPAAMSLPPNATIAEIEAKRQEMGLDQPLARQFLIWLKDAAHGEFGRSIQFRRDAGSLVAQTLPATVELAAVAMIIASVLGLGGGLLLFHVRGTALEVAGDIASTLLLSIPEFLWGLFLLFVFGVAFHLLPFTGRLSAGFVRPDITGFLLLDSLLAGRIDVFRDALLHLILPAFALGLAFSPAIMRVLRSSLLDVYQEDFIQQLRLRGVSERRILVGHALKNAALPTLTLMGVQFGFLFSGTLLVEVIYSYPGMGNLMVDAVRNAGLDEKTIVFFTSDNGATFDVGGAPTQFFNSNAPLRGHKQQLYEGGIRVPMIARWPGRIARGTTSDRVAANWDMWATFSELTGAAPRQNSDGLSMLPALLGSGNGRPHEFLYWEYHSQGSAQAVRMGRWKGIRNNAKANPNGPIELYDLESDPAEKTNIAASHADIVRRINEIMRESHSRSHLDKWNF